MNFRQTEKVSGLDGKKVSGLFSVGSGVRIVCSWEEQDVQTKPAGFITP